MDSVLAIPVLLAETSLLKVLSISTVIICLSVGLHALVMRELYARLCYGGRWGWLRLSLIVVVLLATHMVQIVGFGMAYHFLIDATEGFTGVYDGSLNDSIYFSAAVYTTVGFGDIAPLGYLRLMVGLEALAGLVLIAWSASFTFVAMSKLAKPVGRDHDDLSRHTLDPSDPPPSSGSSIE